MIANAAHRGQPSGSRCGPAHQGNDIRILTILAQGDVGRIPSPSSAAVPPSAAAPSCRAKRGFQFGKDLVTALLSCEVISASVPPAAKPINRQSPDRRPASITVGTSFRAAIRVGAVTASARNLPVDEVDNRKRGDKHVLNVAADQIGDCLGNCW